MSTNAGTFPLLRSWAIQRRVIGALLMREILTRYGRHNIGFLWLFVEPMLFTLGVTAIWTATKSFHGSTVDIVSFAVTGYSTVLLWRVMPSRCIGAIQPNLALMYHRNVKVIDIFLSRVILEAFGTTASFITLVFVFVGIGWMSWPEDLLKVLEGWVLLAWFGFAFGILLGAIGEISEMVDKIWHPASYVFFPISGAAFLVYALPKTAQNIVLYLPMVHCTELVRDGYFGSSFEPHYSVMYIVSCNLGLSIAALAMVRYISKKVVPV